MSQIHRQLRVGLIWSAVLGLMVACANPERYLEPPVVQLTGLTVLDNGQASVDLMVTNLNSLGLMAQAISFRWAYDGDLWLAWEQAGRWQVSANAREVLRIETGLDRRHVSESLALLERGERTQLPYAITLTITLESGRVLTTEQTGFLYPMPGQPGRFR